VTDPRSLLQATLGQPFNIERELGGGGMSRVFLATETALGRKVVIKLLAPELTADINVDRFKREILVAAKLQHPHIVPVLASGESQGLPYYSMPFVEGESARARLARGPLAVPEAVSILRDVARALAYAHSRGIVHRDIKPDNILISGGSATVTDFGIAKAISAARTQAPGATLTQIGMSVGTPAYMAPEQAAGDPDTDHRADIYAFGCTAYELLAGRPPFIDRSPQRLLAAQMGETPVAITDLRPDTPHELAALVMRCLEKSPDDRPQTAGELTAVLDTVTSRGHVAIPGGSGRMRLLRALATYIIAFVVVAIVARAAINVIGLPPWVFKGALIVMALGLPMILLTAFTHHVARKAVIATPTYTPGGTATSPGPVATMALKASPHLSWRRTTLGGLFAVGTFVLLVGGFMLLRELGVGSIGSLIPAGKMNARDPLIIADFAVKNADTSLGPVVSDAVRAGLSESKIITLVSSAAVTATLRAMKREPTTPVTAAVAREIAERQGVKAYVDGEITEVQGGYIVSLRLVTTDSGIVLASFRETGEGPRGLIDAADELARKLRGKVGESLKAVNATPALADATTGSLEALRKFSAAIRANNIEGNARKAIALSREAVAIDTAFASAWRILAIGLGNINAPRSSRDSAMERAYRFRDRLPEVERLRTTAVYYMSGPHRDRTKSIQAFEALLKIDPGARANNMGTQWTSRREFARAESLHAMDVRNDSGIAIYYDNLVGARLHLGRFKEAEEVLAIGRRRFPEHPGLIRGQFELAYAQGKLEEVERFTDSLYRHGNPDFKPDFTAALSSLRLIRGRYAEAQRLRQEANAGYKARGGRIALADSLNELFFPTWFNGPSPTIVKAIDQLLVTMPLHSLPTTDRPYFPAARTYALAGRPDKARQVLAERERAVTDTAILRLTQTELDRALAEIALAEGNGRAAVDYFRRSDVAYDGYPSTSCGACVYFDVARGFDAAEMRDSAIVYYERYLGTPWDNKATEIDDAVLAGTYKRLGELYEAAGNRAKAIDHYSRFVTLWQNADAQFQPRVAEVRQRLARLNASGR
jgi:tetratricopeptide (TPR) repeat protein/tRNA A-37 threonylcarbamoyl transferase component Bud32